MNPTARIRRESIDSVVATSLIAALNEELSRRYPEPGANHFRLDREEVEPGRGAFLVAYLDDRPAGCGAIRRMGPDTAEIKRMYVAPEYRGRGVGRAVLARLEAEARELGVKRLVLETGERQPEAIRMYVRAGYQRAPAFGEYIGTPLSICMAKTL